MSNHDQALLDAIARGDRGAFERMYHAHKDDLLTVTAVITGDRALAEDVLHDVFVKLAHRRQKIELTGSLRNYLIASCLNRARDVFAKNRREATASPLIDDLAQAAEVVDPLEADEEQRQLSGALKMLPAEQREVLTLHLHGQLKFREMADLLAVSINTAQSRYRYALSKLREILSESKT